MNHSTTFHSPQILSTRTLLLRRAVESAGLLWQAWRARSRLHNELRALEGLSDRTLRDIGMAERVASPATLSSIDYERGRW